MKIYCAFLRGINVKGVKIKMSELKICFEKAGFQNVSTLLATGNIVFKDNTNRLESELKSVIEEKLTTTFGYDANIVLRDLGQLKTISEEAKEQFVPETCHNYLLICVDSNTAKELSVIYTNISHEPLESLYVQGDNGFWTVPKGKTLMSEFGSKILGSKKFKNRLTSRNMNTIQKVLMTMLTMEKNSSGEL